MAFELPELNYEYTELEPHIDAKTMEIHHSKHHAGYTNNLNKALEGHPELAEKEIEEILKDLDAVPAEIRTAVQNNGGGYFNHKLFWETMSPNGGGDPTEPLKEDIEEKWGSVETFKDTFKKAALTRFGSGWAWLVVDGNGDLDVVSTANQDNPLSNGQTPLIGIDVWEHAYYLNYQNKRGDYIDAWWSVVDWEKVQKIYDLS